MALRVFFQGHWSLITILYSFTFFPLHVTQLNRNSNLFTTDKHDVHVYTHKFTRTLLLLHLHFTHRANFEPIFRQIFRFPRNEFQNEFSQNLEIFLWRMPDHVVHREWKVFPVNITREPTFFSTHAHFPRLRIALTLELEQSKWIRGEKKDRLSFRHANPRLRADDTYLGNSYENPMENQLWRWIVRKSTFLYFLLLQRWSWTDTFPSTRSLRSLR